ncbi:SDR family NAD(P)-dependent oxidoreductase [Kocuria atrinae]|uniref:SDR family NAD(P)-dependent oxidoreductase n=1 Tax=Kocuria atrinae TaxID=592377 RepID=UPI001CB8C1A5|nr:SDR family NAD(P)-dependent oxidoreductase [Kocuria atrinae]
MNIWVVSGCSSGLGRCWTESIIEERGEKVIGITRSQKAANKMARVHGDLFIPLIADVRDSELLRTKLTEVGDLVGAPNRIVTAAGFAQFGTLEDLSNEQIRAQFATNVEGTLNVIRPLLPMMRERGSARILVVSSMSGTACWPLLGAYQISKYAVEALSDTLRQELRGSGIEIGCIEPGPHKTGWATTYARRTEVGPAYDAEDLIARSSCGFTIEDPVASLPFFWKMFDAPVMPRRIATSPEFVELAAQKAQDMVRDWSESFAY